MALVIIVAVVVIALVSAAALWHKSRRSQVELEQHSITPEGLHSLIASNDDILIFDVRQPLDLLAYPEIIPGAQRIPPNEVIEKPLLIPSEKDSVVYCTCPS